ncbi:MAG: glycoside hydrolase family 68 protein [Nitriliruptoraceae bacterium]
MLEVRTRRASPALRALTPLAALALFVAACGAGEEEEGADDTDGVETTDDGMDDEGADDDGTDDDGTDGDGTDGDGTDGDDEGSQAEESDAAADLTLGAGGSWTPEQAERIELSGSNTAPLIDPTLGDERALEDHWMWDWWPVRDRSGEVADIDGWQVAIVLSAPADVLPGQRHDIATLRYLVSDDDGRTWEEGGRLFPEGDPAGSRQWAGSAMYEDGTIYAFYTAAGEDGEQVDVPTIDEARQAEEDGGDNGDEESESSDGGDYQSGEDISYEQRMALSIGQARGDEDGVTFSDWEEHSVLLEADDELYAATAGTEGGAGEIDAFRDPWFFQDPADGEEYLLFTATMPEAECDGDGVVGMAQRDSDDLRSWELMPPLLDAHCVNNELERPQIVVQDDRYYLLFTTHEHTFDDIEGPEGLYGFVADDLFGPYEPLNDSGLVLANPEEEPYQAYSWMTLADGLVTSFFQYQGLEEGQDLTYIGDQDPDFQVEAFGGTFAPTVEVRFDGSSTEVGEELAPGQVRR